MTPYDIAAILLGWPFLIIALLFSAIGLWKKKPWMLYFAALLATPMSFYAATGAPILPAVFPFLMIYSAIEVREISRVYAALLIAPFWLLVFWLGYAVVTQGSSYEPQIRWQAVGDNL